MDHDFLIFFKCEGTTFFAFSLFYSIFLCDLLFNPVLGFEVSSHIYSFIKFYLRLCYSFY